MKLLQRVLIKLKRATEWTCSEAWRATPAHRRSTKRSRRCRSCIAPLDGLHAAAVIAYSILSAAGVAAAPPLVVLTVGEARAAVALAGFTTRSRAAPLLTSCGVWRRRRRRRAPKPLAAASGTTEQPVRLVRQGLRRPGARCVGPMERSPPDAECER